MAIRRTSRGITLIELVVVVGLIGLFMGAVIVGMGAVTNSRVRSATTMVASAVRVAFTRSASTSKSMRMVLDMDRRAVLIEESDMPMLVRRDDEVAAGAEGSTQIEREALEEAERILTGPRQPRAMFKPIAALGFDVDDPNAGRSLGRGVEFKRIEVAHSEKPQTEGRAYLYFWPGGMTERASIQIGRTDSTGSDGVMTVLVSPLTGRVNIQGGALGMERPRDDSEREDRGY